MIGWLILAVWIGGTLGSVRKWIQFTIEATRIDNDPVEADGVVMGIVGGVVAAALWPISLPMRAIVRNYTKRDSETREVRR